MDKKEHHTDALKRSEEAVILLLNMLHVLLHIGRDCSRFFVLVYVLHDTAITTKLPLMGDTKEVFGTHFMPDQKFRNEEVHGYTMTIFAFVR